MGRFRGSLTALALTAVLPGMPDGCTRIAPGPDTAPADAAAVRAVASGIIAADNAGDVDAVLRDYADDAVLISPDGERVTDRATVRHRYQALFTSERAELTAEIDDVAVSGGLAIVRGRTTGRFVSKATGATRPVRDVYLMGLRKDGDGRWRITHLMWHPAR